MIQSLIKPKWKGLFLQAIILISPNSQIARSYHLGNFLKPTLRSFQTHSILSESDSADIITPESRWEVKPIGVVESPYMNRYGTPKQPTIVRDGGKVAGKIKLYPGYEDCIDHLDGFDYIWVISLMHLNSGFKRKIKPQPREGAIRQPPEEVGLFCSRAPHRPNPVAMSALQITNIDHLNGIIDVVGIDLLNGTPILDIKPYVPAFDSFPSARAGWMDDIMPPDIARENGYQQIQSKRGERQARAVVRKRAAIENEANLEIINDSDTKIAANT